MYRVFITVFIIAMVNTYEEHRAWIEANPQIFCAQLKCSLTKVQNFKRAYFDIDKLKARRVQWKSLIIH
jgi:hypothetical protein